MKRTKKILAILLSFAMIMSFIPTKVVHADGQYVLTFTKEEGHTFVLDGSKLKVDGQYVEVRDKDNDQVDIGSASLNGNTATITVASGKPGVLNYAGANLFTLYENDHPFNIDTVISGNMQFNVQDYESGGGGGGGETGNIGIHFDNNATRDGNVLTFTFKGAQITANVTGVAGEVAQWSEGAYLSIDSNHLGDVKFTFSDSFDKSKMNVMIIGDDEYHTPLAIGDDNSCSLGGLVIPGNEVHFEIQDGNSGDPQPMGNKTATINLSSMNYNGSSQWTGQPCAGHEVITLNYSDTWTAVSISINGDESADGRTRSLGYEPEDLAGGTDKRTPEQIAQVASQEIKYFGEDTDTTIDMDFFMGSWGDQIYAVKINNVDYSNQLMIDTNNDGVKDTSMFRDRYTWLTHFRDQGFGFTIEKVPVAADGVYNVEVALAPNTECYIGNFLWSNDDYFSPEGENPNDLYIGHSKLTLISVDYYDADPTYDFNATGGYKHIDINATEGESKDEVPYVHYQLDRMGVAASSREVPTSEMVIPEGAWVTMKIEPFYGYQVKSFNVTGDDIKLGNTSVFSFKVGKGNFHIGAHVEKQEDDVKVKTDSVSSANVELADGTLETGSARLQVDDADISAEKKADFDNEAKKGGYEIESYLDLELDQVFYKGTGNSDDVWANPMNDLEKPATIALALPEDTNPEDVAIIHNIHNGDEFEVIKTEYIKEYNAIVFETDSFSDFAIATKGEKQTSTGTVSSEGILVLQDSPSIVAGLVHEKSNPNDDLEFRWVACEENSGAWFEISPWTKNNEWLNWTPDEAGNYIIVCYARVIGNRNESQIYKSVGVVYSKHVIKDICQIPYEDGYLIGFETKDNPNQSYQYEMLVMDLTLYAQGNPNCWILSTGRATVSEGNAAWITWKPQYGYYLTLFRVYDADGKLLDQQCYGFVNAY